jgi:hypothetical protein
MATCLAVSLIAIRRGHVETYRAYMMRAYAISLATGAQAFTEGVGSAVFGTGVIQGDLAKAAGWALNLAFAEWAIRRPVRSAPPHRLGRPHRVYSDETPFGAAP